MFRKLSPRLRFLISLLAAVFLVVAAATAIRLAGTASHRAPDVRAAHRTHSHSSSSPTSPAGGSASRSHSSPTSPSSPTATSAAGGWSCVTSGPSDSCGAYAFAGLVNSNGYNTYVANNCWGDPSCKQTVSANSPADWQVVSVEPRGNTAVLTYPDVQQLFQNWCGPGVWDGCADPTDTPISALSGLKFGYALTMPPDTTGTIAQAAYDVWTSDPKHGEVMIWVDNDNRGSGGAKFVTSHTTSDGHTWSLYLNGSEVIWSLGARGTFAQQTSMSNVPVPELLAYLVNHGYEQEAARVSQIDFGWEICSTGGGPQTFALNDYFIAKR